MRRCAAPSQLLGNSTKKPRFISPGKILLKDSEHSDAETKIEELCERQFGGSTSVNICSATSDFNSSVTAESKKEFPCKNERTVICHLKTGMKSLYRTKVGDVSLMMSAE